MRRGTVHHFQLACVHITHFVYMYSDVIYHVWYMYMRKYARGIAHL